MRSKMTTLESTAMPMVRMMPAMPGSVSVAPMADWMPNIRVTLTTRASSANRPNSP
jgi:hypothetical protein